METVERGIHEPERVTFRLLENVMQRKTKLLLAAWLLVPTIVLIFHLLKIFTPPRKIRFPPTKEHEEAAKYVPPADNFQEVLLGTNSLARTNIYGARKREDAGDERRPNGALSGRVVFVNAGHGWVYSNDGEPKRGWHTARSATNSVLEDHGNQDQMTMFVEFCFNAGATVVPFRPVGFQTNEVVLDNNDAEVTFNGNWQNSASTVFYGDQGEVPYRYASLADEETATAIFVPRIPEDGFYPVYTWARHGADRTSQLYRILHTGGQSLIRVPHHKVGNGWAYLGTYYFVAGSNANVGAVVVSNLRKTNAPGRVVVADAIRFGNGLGSIIPRGAVERSGYAREEECAKYWIQTGIGQGQPDAIYDSEAGDGVDTIDAPARMARQMARETAGSMFNWIYLSLHSNAHEGKLRGTMALYNYRYRFFGASTPNQRRFAEILGREVNDHLSSLAMSLMETRWFDRGTNVTLSREEFAFGEINNKSIGNEFDATILELGFHDNAEDAALLREPIIRREAARAAYQGIVRYMHEFDRVPLVFLPESPNSLSVRVQAEGGVRVEWEPPMKGGHQTDGYRVYRSTNGYGFGQAVYVGGMSNCSISFEESNAGQPVYYRVTAVNAGGESLPSPVMGCLVTASNAASNVLFVSGFDRLDSGLNVRQSIIRHKGQTNETLETFDRIIPRRMNSFDYVVQHGQAMSANGIPFDACDHSAVVSGRVQLSSYRAVIWALGRESTKDKTFDPRERSIATEYLKNGGNLFISGTDIARDLGGINDSPSDERLFLESQLHAKLVDDDAGTFRFAAIAGGIFEGIHDGWLDDGTKGTYRASKPDVLAPAGVGAKPILRYLDGKGGCAGIQYDGSADGGKLVFLAFPFESIVSAKMRDECMARVMEFFGVRGENGLQSGTGRDNLR